MDYLIILTVLVQFLFIGIAAVAKDFAPGLHDSQVLSTSSLDVVPHVLRLTRREVVRPIIHDQQIYGVPPSGLVNLTTTNGIQYETEISIGNQTFGVVVDTGSLFSWVVKTGFECVKKSKFFGVLKSEPEEDCTSGATLDETQAFEPIPGSWVELKYLDGRFFQSTLGYANITIAGITIRQEIGLATVVSVHYGNKASGLIGLGYPSEQTDDVNDPLRGLSGQNESIFSTMAKDGLVQPMFSLAIERGEPAGYLAFGGLPPVSYVGQFITTPFYPRRQRYYITIDAIEFSDSKKTKTFTATWPDSQMFVDSGTTFIYLPSKIAKDVNSQFKPEAKRGWLEDVYKVECNAKPPKFAVRVGGQSFWVNPQDMIQKVGDRCESGIQVFGDEGIYILGDVFLKNVIAVFDVGAKEMRFAPREILYD